METKFGVRTPEFSAFQKVDNISYVEGIGEDRILNRQWLCRDIANGGIAELSGSSLH